MVHSGSRGLGHQVATGEFLVSFAVCMYILIYSKNPKIVSVLRVLLDLGLGGKKLLSGCGC